jgi:23S rRNA pseudouridine955/2504/2580 synthase
MPFMVSLATKNSPKVQYLQISEESEGQRIDNFLITLLKGVPKTRVYRSVRSGEVRVNKGRVKPAYRLMSGDSVRIPPIRQATPASSSLSPHIPATIERSLVNELLYEDDDLIVLNKPSGLAVHGGSGLSYGVIEAIRILRPGAKTLELVHRLDRDTSGCLMIAKKRSALRYIHEQLQEGKLTKKYIALVQGDWRAGSVIEAALLKNQLSSGERIVRVSDLGKESRTEFQVLQRFGFATLMEVTLITGRTHQIRVHCQHAGHPVANDPKYGDETFNRQMKEKNLSRLFLHASQLSFCLPKSGKSITIEAPLENKLNRFLKELAGEQHV